MTCVHCNYNVSQMDLIASINEENKRRKRNMIILASMYVESVCLGLTYLSAQRTLKSLGWFSDEEHQMVLGNNC